MIKKMNNQKDTDIASLPFGRRGNVGDNGCGALAVYNANVILGLDTSFEEVLHGFNNSKGILHHPTIAGGVLGANPLYIKKYYVSRGYFAKWNLKKTKVSKDADAYIALSLYRKHLGGHYQAGVYNRAELNVYNPEEKMADFSKLYESYDNHIYMGVLEIYNRIGALL